MIRPIHGKNTERYDLINFEDNGIFEILYKKYWELLLNFAGRFISDKDTCKEIVQELFITLHVKGRQLSINASLSAYLYSSTRNKVINHLRKESVYKKHVAVAGKVIQAVTAVNDIEQTMDAADLQKELLHCINKLPAKHREVYVLVEQEACSLQKTAEILQRPVETVEKQLRKAVRQVQNHLASVKYLRIHRAKVN